MKLQNLIHILMGIVCIGLLQRAHAVVPAPDGGYPNFTTAEGTNALLNLTSGAANTGLGWSSLLNVTTGSFNTGVGAGALALNNGDSNTATGTASLLLNTTGANNTANGTAALLNNTTGSFNTAAGDNALLSNTIGTENTANGAFAISANTEGSFNTAIGVGALNMNTTGASNTALGDGAGLGITGDGNVCLGALVIGAAGLDNTTWIRNINTTPQGFISNTNNYVTVRMTDGRLGFSSAGFTTAVSSRRYKEDIKAMDKASEALFALKPVAFRYKKNIDPAGTSQLGLVAEDVEKVNPDLVVRDKEHKPYSVRYDQVNAMLLNEFLKEHRKVQEQQAIVAQLKSTLAKKETIDAHQQEQIEALTVGLQKVSAQLAAASPSHGGLEATKFAIGRIRSGGPAPQVVNNP
jgi:hypothetical protein